MGRRQNFDETVLTAALFGLGTSFLSLHAIYHPLGKYNHGSIEQFEY